MSQAGAAWSRAAATASWPSRSTRPVAGTSRSTCGRKRLWLANKDETELFRGGRRGRESWLTAAIPMDNPYCSCKLTRVRRVAEEAILANGVARLRPGETFLEVAKLLPGRSVQMATQHWFRVMKPKVGAGATAARAGAAKRVPIGKIVTLPDGEHTAFAVCFHCPSWLRHRLLPRVSTALRG